MTELQVGQQYLVTNIKFKHSQYQEINPGQQRVDEFKVPTDIKEIHEWLEDYGSYLSDKDALAAYIRSILFYNFEMTYDFQLLKELPVPAAFQFGYITYADLADHQYAEFTTAIVDIDIPIMHLCTLSADDVMFANNDIEQALFENMMHNLPIGINVLTVTDLIAEHICESTAELNASTPDNIAESMFERIESLNSLSDQKQNEIFDAVQNLLSVLLVDISKYM